MWVNSKRAAEILSVKYDTIKKATQRAEKVGKKFCIINGQNCLFNRISGNIGGAGGKTLQIWIDDSLINNESSEISRQSESVCDNKRGGANLNGAAAADPSASGGALNLSNALSCSSAPSLNGAEQSSSDPSSATSLPAIATCSDKKRKAAFEKYNVVREWEDAKGKIGEATFLEYINAKKICCVKVTANKLYDW